MNPRHEATRPPAAKLPPNAPDVAAIVQNTASESYHIACQNLTTLPLKLIEAGLAPMIDWGFGSEITGFSPSFFARKRL
jgi:hypothetical protein